MNKRYVILIALCLLFLTAYLTNPSKDDYVSFVKQELINEDHKIAAIFLTPFFDAATTKRNYGLFTVYETKFDEKDKESLKAVGAFNHFFMFKTK